MNAHAPPPAIGIYPLRDAARLAQLDVQKARRWAVGYDYQRHGQKRHSTGVLAPMLPLEPGHIDLTFAEMLTLRLVKAFIGAGLGLRTIKRVAEVAAREFSTPTPFVSQMFRTDGRKVFVELRKATPANDEPPIAAQDRKLIEVLSRQHAFADIVEPSLYTKIEWVDDLVARWWPLGKDHSVVLDPKTLFGAPGIAETRVSTATWRQPFRPSMAMWRQLRRGLAFPSRR